AAGRIRMDHRWEGIPEMGVPADGHRHEFDCRVLYGGTVRKVYRRLFSNSSRHGDLSDFRDGSRAVVDGDSGARDLLAYSLLDVSAEDLSAYLRVRAS